MERGIVTGLELLQCSRYRYYFQYERIPGQHTLSVRFGHTCTPSNAFHDKMQEGNQGAVAFQVIV